MTTATLSAARHDNVNGLTVSGVNALYGDATRKPLVVPQPPFSFRGDKRNDTTSDSVATATPPSRWGYVMTWTLLFLCAVASVLANVAGAQDRVIAQIFAGAPPVVFLACVEVILRAEVPKLFRYTWARFVGLVIVAAVSAYASYVHQVHLLLSLDEPSGIAHTLPAALDGAMLLASVTLLGLADAKRQATSTAPPVPVVKPVTKATTRDSGTPPKPVAPTTPVASAPRQPKPVSRQTTATRQLVADAYTPGATATDIHDTLTRQGHNMSLRTIQRHLKAAA